MRRITPRALLQCWFMALVFVLVGVVWAGSYSPTVVMDLPWGAGPGAMGLLQGPEIETVGPLSFEVNEGKVYLLDSVYQDVKVFDLSTLALEKIGEKIVGSCLTIAPDKSVLVLKGNKVLKVSRLGAVQDTIDIAPEINLVAGYGQEVRVKADQSVAVNRFDGKEYKIAGFEAGVLKKLPADRQLARGKAQRTQGAAAVVSWDVRWVDRNTVRLTKYNAKDKAVESFDLKTPDAFGGVQVKGVDQKGNVYIELERITADNYVHLEIRKISPSGKELATVELSNNYFTTVYKKTEVEAIGDIYQMLTTEDGVQMIRWAEK
jgi:hypothetical protein